LKKCLEGIFGFTDTTILKIAKDDKFPALSVSNTLNAIIREFGKPKDSSFLLILAYIGHGNVGEDGSLLMAANSKQFIKWRYLRDRYFQADDPASFLDVLGILDCCYAGIAVRGGGPRTCQLLAACDGKHTARSRKGGITFTQRLIRAAHGLRLQSTKQFALVEELFGEIQREKPPTAPDAVFASFGGLKPIALPFKGHSAGQLVDISKLSLDPAAHPQNVLVELTIAGGDGRRIVSEFQELIANFPPQFRATVVDAYQSRSVLFLILLSWFTYARLLSAIDFRYVGFITGPSLIPDSRPASEMKGSLRPPVFDENMPLSPRQLR